MTKENLWLVKPSFLKRLPDPSEIDDTEHHDAWITAAQDGPREAREQLDELQRIGENVGLIVAEIELASADQAFDRPDWLGREVSTDPRYYNSSLSERPYCTWSSAS